MTDSNTPPSPPLPGAMSEARLEERECGCDYGEAKQCAFHARNQHTELREITCETCNGDGMFEVNQGHGVVGEIVCRDCDGKGHILTPIEPITMKDLDYAGH